MNPNDRRAPEFLTRAALFVGAPVSLLTVAYWMVVFVYGPLMYPYSDSWFQEHADSVWIPSDDPPGYVQNGTVWMFYHRIDFQLRVAALDGDVQPRVVYAREHVRVFRAVAAVLVSLLLEGGLIVLTYLAIRWVMARVRKENAAQEAGRN